MNKVRIVSDGPKEEGNMVLYSRPRVLAVAEDGTEIDITENVVRVTWKAEPGVAPTAVVELLDPQVDVVGQAERAGAGG